MSIAQRTKVAPTHLQRKAFVYVRQSTVRQVYENTESTRRQYDLHQTACELGWPSEHVVTIDADQGQSGASRERGGFKQLVAEVGLGHAGIVLGLEVSRLARNSSDWHQLLEICALTDTLISDEGGVYDPSDFNDRLLLGLKGTMSEAELHVMRARLRGGALNKARRGELACPLPVGLVYDPRHRVVLDPDAQVQGSIRLLFETFDRLGTAYATVKHFRQNGLLFPKRTFGGARDGELTWTPLRPPRAVTALRNPRYAGAFVFGRRRSRKRPGAHDSRQRVPREQWHALLLDAHPGYITWAQHESIGARLAASARANGDFGQRSARQGLALLQGLLLCGVCGMHMRVRYKQRRDALAPVYTCHAHDDAKTGSHSVWLPGLGVDAAVGDLLVRSLTPMAVDIALAVEQEIGTRVEQTDRLHAQHIERARYLADLARRRFMQVDPDNRLVAGSLEALWNDALRDLNELQNEHDRRRSQDRTLRDPHDRDRLRALATDFAAIWRDPRTAARDRKRMARLLIEDITLRMNVDDVTLLVRFRGGATDTLTLPRGRPNWQTRKTEPAVVAQVDRLLDQHTCAEIAALLNQQGHTTGAGLTFTTARVDAVVTSARLKIFKQRLIDRGMCTAAELARRLRVKICAVYSWQRDGKIHGRRCNERGEWMYDPHVRPVHWPPHAELGAAGAESVRDESASKGAV